MALVRPFETWGRVDDFLRYGFIDKWAEVHRTLPWLAEQAGTAAPDLDQTVEVLKAVGPYGELRVPTARGVSCTQMHARRLLLLRGMRVGNTRPSFGWLNDLIALGQECGLYRRDNGAYTTPQVLWVCQRTPGCAAPGHTHTSSIRSINESAHMLYTCQVLARLVECAATDKIRSHERWGEFLDMLGDGYGALTDGHIGRAPGIVGCFS